MHALNELFPVLGKRQNFTSRQVTKRQPVTATATAIMRRIFEIRDLGYSEIAATQQRQPLRDHVTRQRCCSTIANVCGMVEI